MIRVPLAAALLAAAPVLALGGGPDGRPGGPPPRVMVLNVERDGTPYIVQTVTEFVPEQRTQEVKVGKEIQKRVVTVYVPVRKQVRVGLDGKDVQIFDSNGKRLALQDVPRMLKAVPVLVSADGKPVHPFYLRLVREGTLVVAAPSLTVPAETPVNLPPAKVPPPVKTPEPK
jgi:hypothetical protein